MDAEQSKGAIFAVWKAFGTRDEETIAACIHPKVVWDGRWRNATAVALGTDLPMTGPEVIVAFVANDFRALYRGAEIEIFGICGDTDRAIIEERTRATLPDGRPCDNTYCFVFESEDGLVVRIREHMDTSSGWRQVLGETSVTTWPG